MPCGARSFDSGQHKLVKFDYAARLAEPAKNLRKRMPNGERLSNDVGLAV